MSFSRLTCKGVKLSFVSPEKSSLLQISSRRASSRIYPENEYTASPCYPTILDLNPDASSKRNREAKLNKLKKVGTIEEKLIGINMPRYYGWNSLILKEGSYPFNFMPFVQHITRTDFIETEKLPFSGSLSESELDVLIDKIRPQLQDAILHEVSKRKHIHEFDGSLDLMEESELHDLVAKGVVEQINRVLSVNLADAAPHLYDTEIDYEPRIEAFWRVGGFYPDQETYDKRKKDKKDHENELKTNRFAKRKIEEEPDDLLGHFVQYLGTPLLQLRHSKPLRPLEPKISYKPSPSDGEVSTATSSLEPKLSGVPCLRYDPEFYGLEKKRRHGTNIPGFWPGDPNEFGLLSFHSRGHLLGRPPSFGQQDERHTINSQGILAGYAWLLAQANYQGFNTFHDVTYPLSTTTVVTDGRIFSFFASQLNTLLFYDEFIDTNPKVNVCYGLPSVNLYEKINGNEIIGWNDNTLALMVEAYLNTPAVREGVNLKPYVNKSVPLIKDIDHAERRAWLHAHFRHLFTNRPRDRALPEIWDWEQIYKIKYQTRPVEPRRRFFELDIDPFKRPLNEHAKVYIPRKFRDPDNYKKKFKDTFYPDV